MNQDEKRKLDNQLIAMGLPALNDPMLIQRMADLISDWPGDRDEFFQDLLGECDAKKRAEMYNAMAPKLRFKARSLVEYETSIQMRVSQMVSQRRMKVEGYAPSMPYIGERKPEEAAKATLICHRCKRRLTYKAETPVSAIIKARKAGWVRTVALDQETCPSCMKKLKVSAETAKVGHA